MPNGESPDQMKVTVNSKEVGIPLEPGDPAKKRRKRKYGVKIRNPLKLPVSAWIRCKSGALRPGAMDGTETTREIRPGEEVFIATKGSCELEIDLRIIRYDEVGNTVIVGMGDGRLVGHTDPFGGDSPPAPRKHSPADPGDDGNSDEDEVVEIRPLGDMLEDHAKEAATQ